MISMIMIWHCILTVAARPVYKGDWFSPLAPDGVKHSRTRRLTHADDFSIDAGQVYALETAQRVDAELALFGARTRISFALVNI